MSSPAGQIVMADRAAVTAQEAASQVDMATAWQQFVARYFEQTESAAGERWTVRDEQSAVLVQYDQEVSLGNQEIEDVRIAFQEVSSNLVDKEELQRFCSDSCNMKERLHLCITQSCGRGYIRAWIS